jgi:hypothetical protein
VPDGAYFTWHSPSLHNDYAGRLYVWTEKRAKIMVCERVWYGPGVCDGILTPAATITLLQGRNNPKIWLQQCVHDGGAFPFRGGARDHVLI